MKKPTAFPAFNPNDMRLVNEDTHATVVVTRNLQTALAAAGSRGGGATGILVTHRSDGHQEHAKASPARPMFISLRWHPCTVATKATARRVGQTRIAAAAVSAA